MSKTRSIRKHRTTRRQSMHYPVTCSQRTPLGVGAAIMALPLLIASAPAAAQMAVSNSSSDQSRAALGQIPATDKRPPGSLPGLESLFAKGRSTPSILAAGEAFRPVITGRRNGQIRLQWSIAPGYYLYRDRTTYQLRGKRPDQLSNLTPTYAREGEVVPDPHFGEQMVFKSPVAVTLQAAPGAQPGTQSSDFEPRELRIAYQGCLTDRLCYPAQVVELALPMAAPEPASASPLSGP